MKKSAVTLALENIDSQIHTLQLARLVLVSVSVTAPKRPRKAKAAVEPLTDHAVRLIRGTLENSAARKVTS